jgi:hypothetical protein
MNQSASFPVESAAPKSSSSGYLAVFGLMLLSVVASLFVRSHNRPVEVDEPEQLVPGAPAPAVDWSSGIRKVQARLAQISSEADEKEAEILAGFAARWKAGRERGVQSILASKTQSVEALLSSEELTGLVADFALDKVRGGERAVKRVERCSQPFFAALKEMGGAGDAELRMVQEQLRELDNQFAQKIGVVVQDSEATVPPQTFAALCNLEKEALRGCVKHTASAGVAVVVEVAFAAATAESVKVVAAWLGRLLAPQIFKAAAGVSTIEIPVVDLISLGLLGWTIHDVWTLSKKIGRDLDVQFSSAMDAQLKQLDWAIDAAVENLKQQHCSARQKALEQASAALR